MSKQLPPTHKKNRQEEHQILFQWEQQCCSEHLIMCEQQMYGRITGPTCSVTAVGC